MKNIVLIGLSGSGKTTIGRLLARDLCRVFVDMDSKIEKSQGMSINEIFQKGLDFREMERELAKEISSYKGAVISTGGGIILQEGNIRNLRKNGILIFINRPLPLLEKDIAIENRPLLDKKGRILELHRQRIYLYRKYADFEVLNDQVFDEQLLRGHLSANGHLSTKGHLQELIALQTIKKLVKTDFTTDTPKKRSFAVIGSPIAHSLSPKIHRAVFQRLGYDFDYDLAEVKKEGLEHWLAKVRGQGICGFNATMPLKVNIIPMLDSIQEEARLYHSVNTVVNREGRLQGYSTDADGFLLSVRERCKLDQILILGAGGVVNTLAMKLCLESAGKIKILNRTPEHAEAVCKKVGDDLKKASSLSLTKAEYGSLTTEAIKKHCQGTSLLINATPLGMEGCKGDFEDFSFLDRLPKEALVCDLIYAPAKTTLLREAEKRGLKILNGLGMLIYQALLADQHFLDLEFDMKQMYEHVQGLF